MGDRPQAFVSAFASRYTFGALVTFVDTLASHFLEPGNYGAEARHQEKLTH